MLFTSFEFFSFFLIIFITFRFLGLRGQNGLLLAGSYWFYAAWDWRFLFLILTNTVVDYTCGKKIDQAPNDQSRKIFLTISLCTNLGILGFFKYYNFFADSFETFSSSFGWMVDELTLNIILPVGISFYTFQTLSYTIDVFYRKLEPERNFLNFALFVSFFPQLVAGPIERARNFLPQLRQQRTVTGQDVREALWFIYWGFFLKVFVADNFAKIVDVVFAEQGMPNGLEAMMAIYSFAFQIFGDFAGYSSMAIGFARLFGIRLMTNFLYPYFVTNPSDFWKHWHISLSSWLRDYLYIPLGGNRGSVMATYRNVSVTMLLGGLWHGAAWTFVLWGAYQGAILVIHRIISSWKFLGKWLGTPGRLYRTLQVLFMFQVTCLGWLIFRAGSVEQIGSFLQSMFIMLEAPSPASLFYATQLIFFGWLMTVIMYINYRKNDLFAIIKLRNTYRLPILLAMFYSIAIWGEFGGKEFIYFQF